VQPSSRQKRQRRKTSVIEQTSGKSARPYLKITKAKCAWGVAQMAEHLPSKQTLVLPKKKKKRKTLKNMVCMAKNLVICITKE
jgi:hypothetical protein